MKRFWILDFEISDAESFDSFRRLALYGDMVVKGAESDDPPVERRRNFEIVINLKAREQFGLTIP